ncbi:hypothetical protein NITGR_650009 [Nitrospina gracilis 3/211]|uniref:Uncharacterized protein n=1 Tax=Nitrospina gracilis (strain 3/211) TaxID=1266370 RepID=M1ZD83_NITG3|nr:hypothetical protein NITGR_650009 [Nitrospina gracilis 3/211]
MAPTDFDYTIDSFAVYQKCTRTF